MSGKYALIIGNTEYIDPGLAQLTAPGKDAEDFARVLKDQNFCAFDDVRVLINPLSSSAIEIIDEFFDQKKPDDLLVMYFSGHGVRDEAGSLYLAFTNTIRSRLRSTAIKDEYIRGAMDQSRSKRQVLILDCCNSGAFPQGTKAELGGSMGMTQAFQGYGRFVLTASDATQFAWEGDKVIGETDNSLFTHFLVKGLEGDADGDGDGRITVDELYDYAYDQISKVTTKQTPTKSAAKVAGEIILRQITRMEDIKPVALPDELVSEIEDIRPYVREVAVQKLERILKGKNIGLARSAAEALEKIVSDENTTRRVAQSALQALDAYRQLERKGEEEQKESEEVDRLAAQKAEADRRAREEAERLAKQKAEADRAAKIEADRKAKQEADRLAAQKAEVDRKAAKVKPVQVMPIEIKAETVSTEAVQRKPLSMGLVIGGMAVVGLVIAGIVFNAIVHRGAQAVETPPPPNTVTEAPVVTNPTAETPHIANSPTTKPAETQALTPTSAPSKFPSINFVKNTNMDIFDVSAFGPFGVKITKNVYSALSDDGLVLTFNDKNIYLYYTYKPYVYKNVGIRFEAQNLGKTERNNVSLICRKNTDTWYEYVVTNNGLWYLYNYNVNNSPHYTPVSQGGTKFIKGGQSINVYEMRCVGNDISLSINGREVKTVQSDLYSEGRVGFNVSSLDQYPITVKVNKFEVFEP